MDLRKLKMKTSSFIDVQVPYKKRHNTIREKILNDL